jgi:hypothetical protein
VRQTVVLWQDRLTDADFAGAFRAIRTEATLFIFSQCFSGGLHYNLRASDRIVISACGPNEISWARRDQQHNAFLYQFFAGLLGEYPDTGQKIRSDGAPLSLADAWNWALARTETEQTPQISAGGEPNSEPLDAPGASRLQLPGPVPGYSPSRKQLGPPPAR